MTVAELAAALERIPPEHRVVFWDVTKKEEARNVNLVFIPPPPPKDRLN